jgi:hypothetical protein
MADVHHGGPRQLTRQIAAPFRTVLSFRVCCHAAVGETAYRRRHSRTEIGSEEIETKTRDKGERGEKRKESINASRRR